MTNTCDNQRPDPPGAVGMPLLVGDRELATILAALRYHQAENLQGPGVIRDQAINEIATDGGRLQALGFDDVVHLCERLNLGARGSYSRQWRCPDCHCVVTCSYDDLAETGAPYCTECDSECTWSDTRDPRSSSRLCHELNLVVKHAINK